MTGKADIRTQLIDIIDEYSKNNFYSLDGIFPNELADKILSDGWVRPRFKVGDEIWFVFSWKRVYKGKISSFKITKGGIVYEVETNYTPRPSLSEKDIYVTETEALSALKNKNSHNKKTYEEIAKLSIKREQALNDFNIPLAATLTGEIEKLKETMDNSQQVGERI